MSRKQRLQCDEVVALDDKVAIEPGLFALPEDRQFAVELKRVMWDRVVIALNRGLSFELQNRHLWLRSYEFASELSPSTIC